MDTRTLITDTYKIGTHPTPYAMQVSYYRSFPRTNPEFFPIKDLLMKQRKGEFLTFEEKERIKKYNEERRLKNLQKKKRK